MAVDDDSLGPLFGGPPLKANRRVRRVGPPKVAFDPVWSNASESNKAGVLKVLEALNDARRAYGMPAVKTVRLSPTAAIPVLRRMAEVSEEIQGMGIDVVDLLCACARARVAVHATSKSEEVRRGDYANTITIFGNDERWSTVLNAGRAWLRGDRSLSAPRPVESSTKPAVPRPWGASHGPRR